MNEWDASSKLNIARLVGSQSAGNEGGDTRAAPAEAREGTGSAGCWLAMDTATASMGIALLEGRRLLGESHSDSERNHSIRLLPAVEELLDKAGVRTDGLAGIAAGGGPGSYTGVRIAVSVAKTLAWALNVPLIGVSSLEGMALGALLQEAEQRSGDAGAAGGARSVPDTGGLAISAAGNERTWYVPLLDARRGQVYTGLYESGQGEWRQAAEDRIVPLADWLDELADLAESGSRPPGRIVAVGETGPIADQLESRWGGLGLVLSSCDGYQAAAIGLLAQERYRLGLRTDIHSFIPNYAQLAEAETKWLEKQKQEQEQEQEQGQEQDQEQDQDQEQEQRQKQEQQEGGRDETACKPSS